MSFGMIGLILLAFTVLAVLWAISVYNSLIRQRNLVDEGWSGIDVQLKRRADLVPNLVETVKGYKIHEQNVLENVTKMRTSAMAAQTVEDKAKAEAGLTAALKTLFAVAENYPDLKANQNFLRLQQQLASLENEIQLARRYYNGAARNYNIAIQSFPSNIVAGFFKFEARAYFEIDESERKSPKVKF